MGNSVDPGFANTEVMPKRRMRSTTASRTVTVVGGVAVSTTASDTGPVISCFLGWCAARTAGACLDGQSMELLNPLANCLFERKSLPCGMAFDLQHLIAFNAIVSAGRFG